MSHSDDNRPTHQLSQQTTDFRTPHRQQLVRYRESLLAMKAIVFLLPETGEAIVAAIDAVEKELRILWPQATELCTD